MKGLNRILKAATSVFLFLMLLSCSGPTIHYIGESYPTSAAVDIYYDVKEVKKEYTVMGRMTNDKFIQYNLENVKKEMIKKAKLVGADAVIFYDLSAEAMESYGDGLAVKAQLIKYK